MLTVKYDDFSGGYWGDASDARPNQDNKWYGRNVRVYPNGQIGPRYATTNITNSGLAISSGFRDETTVAAVNTTSAPYAITVAADGGGTLRFYTKSGSGASASWSWADNGSLGSSTGVSGYVIDERNAKVGFGGLNKSFTIGSTTPSTFTTALYVAKHGERAVGTDASVRSRMVFSDASDYYTWGASSFIDIGDGAENIGYISASNNQLYVAKTNGIWLVSGVLGSTATVRKMASVQIAPGSYPAIVRSSEGLLGFVRADGVPCVFDGVRVHQFVEQGTGWLPPSALPGGFLAWRQGSSTMDVLVRELNGGFSRHTFGGFSTNGQVLPHFEDEKYVPYGTTADQFVYVGEYSALQRWIVQMPSTTTSTGLAPLYATGSSANDRNQSGQLQGVFYLPEYYTKAGTVLRVRNVTVQFTKFKANSSLTNEIVAQAVAKGSYEAGDVTSTALTWSESANSATATGTEDSVRFSFGDQGFGNGFQIQFTSLKGVTVKEVVVQCDERARRV